MRPRDGFSRDANRSRDVRSVRDRHEAGGDGSHAAAGRSAGGVSGFPRRRGIAVQRALGRARHGVFGRGRSSQNVYPRCFEEPAEVSVLLRHDAAAQPAAELNRTARLVSKEVFDEERHATERSRAERPFIEVVDAIRVGFDDRVDGGVRRLNRRRRRPRKLLRRYFPPRDQLRQSKGVVAGVFRELHAITGVAQFFT